jgi:hypothetical protein
VFQRLHLLRLLKVEAVPLAVKQVPLYSAALPTQPMAILFPRFVCRPRTSVSSDIYIFYISFLLTSGLVPIYDCRDIRDSFEHVLANLKDIPRYNEDLPSGSCTVLGYTVNTFTKKDVDMPSVAFNIHWVVLLGLPGKGKASG